MYVNAVVIAEKVLPGYAQAHSPGSMVGSDSHRGVDRGYVVGAARHSSDSVTAAAILPQRTAPDRRRRDRGARDQATAAVGPVAEHG
ncbi:hypothetical protein [Micromonospora sp. NPDC049204]|uniref:hypothetical protein n=1 Tax=Micromonospora sp. NPDC049204 TaxID=3154351 RepID=UPI0033D0ECEF